MLYYISAEYYPHSRVNTDRETLIIKIEYGNMLIYALLHLI